MMSTFKKLNILFWTSAVANSWHVAVLWSPICPQKLNVRPQRLLFSQYIPQSGHLSQNTDAKLKVTIKNAKQY